MFELPPTFQLPPFHTKRTIPDPRNPDVAGFEAFERALNEAFAEVVDATMGDLLAQDYRATGCAWIRVDANGSVERIAPTEWSFR